MACNVLALGPRRALALDGNPETRRRLEAAGVEVLVYAGDELSRKGDGGPTCLTRPLSRSDVAAASASSTASSGVLGARHVLDLPARLEDDDVPPERAGEADLRERPPTAADGDHRLARRRRRRGSGRGRSRSRRRGRSTRSPAARDSPGRIPIVVPAGRLRAARGRRHHLAAPAADDGRAALGEQPPDRLGPLLVLDARADDRDLRHGVRRRSVAAPRPSASTVTPTTIAASSSDPSRDRLRPRRAAGRRRPT